MIGSKTVTSLKNINLLAYALAIDLSLQVVVCLTCHHPILTTLIESHVREHYPRIPIPQDLQSLISERVSLSPTAEYPNEVIDPVYGIPILECAQVFCDSCKRGYKDHESFKRHLSTWNCPENGSSHLGYGQLIPGIQRRIIEVDISKLVPIEEQDSDHLNWFTQAIAPARNYAKITIESSPTMSNLSAFFHSDGWLNLIQGYTPEQLHEARRIHTEDEAFGETLRALAQRYLAEIQPTIQENINFGLLKDIGSTTADKKFSFRRLKPDSVVKYSLALFRLVFNCHRFYVTKDWNTDFNYPTIDDSQLSTLNALDSAMKEGKKEDELLACFHAVCLKLFLHEKHQYECSRESSNFFSPVISFLVLHCVTETGATPMCSAISNVVASVMYAIRACIFREVLSVASNEHISTNEYVFFQVYIYQ